MRDCGIPYTYVRGAVNSKMEREFIEMNVCFFYLYFFKEISQQWDTKGTHLKVINPIFFFINLQDQYLDDFYNKIKIDLRIVLITQIQILLSFTK